VIALRTTLCNGGFLGKNIIVTGYNVTKSKRNEGKCLKMQFYYADD